MKVDRTALLVLVAATTVAVAAPFIASSNPDGLEKTAEEVGGGDSWSIEAPIPDYGSGTAEQIGSLVLGALAVFGISIAGGRLLRTGRSE